MLPPFCLLPPAPSWDGRGTGGTCPVCSPGPAGAGASVTSFFLVSCDPFRRQETSEVGRRRPGSFSGRKR